MRDEFPTLPEVGNVADTEIPFDELKAMVGKVIFAVSAEESRFQLNGALLKLRARLSRWSPRTATGWPGSSAR